MALRADRRAHGRGKARRRIVLDLGPFLRFLLSWLIGRELGKLGPVDDVRQLLPVTFHAQIGSLKLDIVVKDF